MRHPLTILGTLMCGLGILVLAGTAQAASKRHTTVIEEHVDGELQPDSAADAAIIQALVNAGVTFIDAAQSQQIRSVTDAGTLMAGTIPAVVSTLDADVIIAGKCQVQKFETRLMDSRSKRYDATLRLRVIAVDTGQIVGVFKGSGQGMGFTPAQAVDDAATEAVKALMPKLLVALRTHEAAGGRVELSISGVPNVSVGRKLLDAVRGLNGVSEATTRHGGRGVTEIEITSDGQTAEDLAVALDSAHGLGLSVFGFSDRAIKAEYLPQAAMDLMLVPTPFTDKRRRAGDAWQASTLSGIVGVSLSNQPFVSLPEGHRVVVLGKTKKWGAALKRLGYDPASTMVLSGTYTRDGDNVQVQAQVQAAASGKTVLAGQQTCARADLAACVSGLGDRLSDALLPSVMKKRQLFKSLPAGKALTAGAPAVRPLAVRDVRVDNVYPARLSAYADQPLGRVSVENTGDEPLTGIVVTTNVPGFMIAPVDTPAPDIASGASAELPLKVVLDRAALLRHDENLPAVLQVTIRYQQGDFRLSDKRSRALVVYDRNTLSWSEPESVASFVTPRTSAVQTLAARLSEARPDASRDHRWSRAAALFVAFGALGLRYERDPVNPYGKEALDYVQFPEQTLSRKRGDCDDLAVLYASLAEALGLPVLLVTTPEHVFVAVHTGVPAHNPEVLSLKPDQLVVHDGTLWLPLETTLTQAPVHAAWTAAVDELNRWKGQPDKVQLIDIRQAWKRFPPTSLMPGETPAPTPDGAMLSAAISQNLSELDRLRAEAFAAAMTALAGDAPVARLGRSRLLALSGELDKARAELEGLGPDTPVRREALNNTGNVHLAQKRAADAYAAYLAAAKLDASDARIQLNAAVAAHDLGREDDFADHIFNAMDLGADDLVARLAGAGIGQFGTRGADGSGRASRDLADAVRQAFERRKRALPAALKAKPDGAVRASDAASAPISLTEHVFWL